MRTIGKTFVTTLLVQLFACAAFGQTQEVSTPQTIVKTSYTFKCEAKWGNGGSGDGQFNSPNAIAVDPSNNVYVCDSDNHRIQKFDADGKFILTYGKKEEHDSDSEERKPDEMSDYMHGVCIDKDGFIFVLDRSNIKKYDREFTFISQITPKDDPGGIFIGPDGFLYVTGQYETLAKMTRNFKPVAVFPLQRSAAGRLGIDGHLMIYAYNSGTNSIDKYKPSGEYAGKWKKGIEAHAVIFDQDNWGYFPDYQKVRVYNESGKSVLNFGVEGVGKGEFKQIQAIAVGIKGEVFICDQQNNCIQKFVKYKVTKWLGQNGEKIKEEETPVTAETPPSNLIQTTLYDPASEAKPSAEEQKENPSNENQDVTATQKKDDAAGKAVGDAAGDAAKKVLGF